MKAIILSICNIIVVFFIFGGITNTHASVVPNNQQQMKEIIETFEKKFSGYFYQVGWNLTLKSIADVIKNQKESIVIEENYLRPEYEKSIAVVTEFFDYFKKKNIAVNIIVPILKYISEYKDLQNYFLNNNTNKKYLNYLSEVLCIGIFDKRQSEHMKIDLAPFVNILSQEQQKIDESFLQIVGGLVTIEIEEMFKNMGRLCKITYFCSRINMITEETLSIMNFEDSDWKLKNEFIANFLSIVGGNTEQEKYKNCYWMMQCIQKSSLCENVFFVIEKRWISKDVNIKDVQKKIIQFFQQHAIPLIPIDISPLIDLFIPLDDQSYDSKIYRFVKDIKKKLQSYKAKISKKICVSLLIHTFSTKEDLELYQKIKKKIEKLGIISKAIFGDEYIIEIDSGSQRFLDYRMTRFKISKNDQNGLKYHENATLISSAFNWFYNRKPIDEPNIRLDRIDDHNAKKGQQITYESEKVIKKPEYLSSSSFHSIFGFIYLYSLITTSLVFLIIIQNMNIKKVVA